jgi:hypothetical protein
MITIFCDFRQYSAKNIGVFLKSNAMIQFLHEPAVIYAKNANFFANFCGENIFSLIFWLKYFKNHNISPSSVLLGRAKTFH